MMSIRNVVCQEIKAPVIVWQWPGSCYILVGGLQFLLHFCNIQSLFGTGFFHGFLTATAKIQTILFKYFSFAQILCCNLPQGFIGFPLYFFTDFYPPQLWPLLKIFPVENIPSLTQ